MKKYCFPPHASRGNRRFSKATQLRAALVFTFVALLSCLPFYALAQDDAPPAKPKTSRYAAVADAAAYVIYQQPNGDTVCRDASLAESRALRMGFGDDKLHQINHLDQNQNAANGPQSPTGTGLTIILRASSQLEANQEAKNAFIAAAAKWEALITDQITIVIDVDYGTSVFGIAFPDSNTLGITATQQLAFDNNLSDLRNRLINHAGNAQESAIYNALPANSLPTDLGSVNTIFAASPILRALGAVNAVADPANEPNFGPPPRIGFNSGFSFDFNPNDGITGNRTDFDAVAVHEMGHALGFNSSVGIHELQPGEDLSASVWDLFRFRPGTVNLNNFNTAQRILSSGGTQIAFNGGAELGLSTGRPDGTGGDGWQASHWKDDNNILANFIGIMDPNISRNRREVLTQNDLTAIDFFGYTLTPPTAPPNDNFSNAVSLSGATGTVTGTNVGASKETGEPVQPTTNPPRAGGRSVWYTWTSTGTGQATFDTNGSTFDTTLAIYTGAAVNGLTLVVANDDISPPTDPEPRNLQSLVTFNATAGTTYRVQVDGFNASDFGPITLHWTGPAGAPSPSPSPTPGPNTVQFSASTASTTETPNATTKVDLLVTRTGNTTAAATVNYASSDATASERSDYLAALGTLHFAGSETSKIITVFIVNDAFGEPAETFNVTLSGPVGCTVGAPAATAVTINSDESVNGTNPVRDASFNSDFFVRQHYLDFFNREPDAGGLAFWKNQIDECTTPACREIRRINVSAAFFKSIEFQETGYLVERLYKVAYGDTVGTSTLGGTHQLSVPIVRLNEFLPDTQEIGRGVIIGQPNAEQTLEANKQAFIAGFVLRSRFTNKYPATMSPGAFVNELSANAGPGVLSPAERDQLVADLTSGAKTRAKVLQAVAEDANLFASETNRAFVLAQFFGYLRRDPNATPDPDYTGYDFWLGKLNQFNGNFVNAEMVKAFILSGEYQARFGP